MIKIKLNADGLSKKLSSVAQKELERQTNAAIEELVADLQAATPIDTGYARSRWTSYNRTSFKISVKFLDNFKISFTEQNTYIENDAPYINALNRGSSKQAPAFFIEQTFLRNGFEPKSIQYSS
jgi:hypothetical protein